MEGNIKRWQKFKDEPLDDVLMRIKYGTIKAGRYSDLVKVDKSMLTGKEFFADGDSKDGDDEWG